MGDGEMIVLQLVIRIIFGVITAMVASSKGRNTVGWFIGGFFLGCIGLIIVLCLSNLKEEQAKWSANEVEQRRLREQLRQEQIKNEALRQHTIARLDQHDDELGVDTRETAPSLMMTPQAQAQPQRLITDGGTPPPGLPTENWYTAENGEQQGPYTFALLHSRAKQGTLPPDTLVWAEGMPEWQAANQVSGLFSG